jgi:hypothetical protein
MVRLLLFSQLLAAPVWAGRTVYEMFPYSQTNQACNQPGGPIFALELWNPSLVTQTITITAYKSGGGTMAAGGSKTADQGTLTTLNISLAANEAYAHQWAQPDNCATANATPRGLRIDVAENNGFLKGRLDFWRSVGGDRDIISTPLNGGRPF